MIERVICKECGGDDLYPWNFGEEFEILGYTCRDCDKDVEVEVVDIPWMNK